METGVYTTTEEERNSIYHRLNSVKKIISQGLTERIIFNNGEIELNASPTEIMIYSKTYLPNGEFLVNSSIVKDLINGYDPKKALHNAKMGILQRIVNSEIKAREKESKKRIEDYFNYERALKRKRETTKFFLNSKKITEEFLLSAKKAV